MGAVTAHRKIVAAQRLSDRYRNSLLADREMGGAAHLALVVARGDLLFHTADALHLEQQLASQARMDAEKKELLTNACAVRRKAAEGNAQALRALAAWAGNYGLKEEASACLSAAYRIDFAPRFTAAGDDEKALDKLAQWCKDKKLSAESTECLRKICALRTQAAGRNTAELVKVCLWCREQGLQKPA